MAESKIDNNTSDTSVSSEDIATNIRIALDSYQEDPNKALNHLRQCDYPQVIELLEKIATENPNELFDVIRIMGELGGDRVIESFLHFLQITLFQKNHEDIKLFIREALEKLSDDDKSTAINQAIKDLEFPGKGAYVRDSVAWLLETGGFAKLLDVYKLQQLINCLSLEEDPGIQRRIARIFGRSHHEIVVDPLIQRLLIENDDSLVLEISQALENLQYNKVLSWSNLATKIIDAIEATSMSREKVSRKSRRIRQAISPDKDEMEQNEYLVEDLFLQLASKYQNDKRVSGIIADFLLDRRSREDIIRRVAEFENSDGDSENELKLLRISLGMEEALEPLFNELRRNLDENFVKFINDLNKQTQERWQSTVNAARYGFYARMAMSIIVFLVGIVLVGISTYALLSQNVSNEQLLGPGISFFSGLATMFAIIYTGPLKEIRKSVTDLNVANAAFISFIHRILQISNTFSYLYLKQEISFEEIRKSSGLLDSAMRDTIINLYLEPQDKEILKSMWEKIAPGMAIDPTISPISEARDKG